MIVFRLISFPGDHCCFFLLLAPHGDNVIPYTVAKKLKSFGR